MNIENAQSMDINDLVLIGGGLFTVAIIIHGLWLAWRARRAPLRVRITPDLVPDIDEGDDLAYSVRKELPNGGGRPVKPVQRGLEFDATAQPSTSHMQSSPGSDAHATAVDQTDTGTEHWPRANAEPSSAGTATSGPPAEAESHPEPWGGGPVEDRVPAQSRTSDLESPEHRSINEPQSSSAVSTDRLEADVARTARRRPEHTRDTRRSSQSPGDTGTAPDESAGQDLLVINLLAPDDASFQGEALLAAMRNQGLKYGDMGIFHRLDRATRAIQYSVANVLEPGHFDMGNISSMVSPGLVFFMQLPGPTIPEDAVEDMLHAAQKIAEELGAVLKDERMTMLTPQTMNYYRERVTGYPRSGQMRRIGAM